MGWPGPAPRMAGPGLRNATCGEKRGGRARHAMRIDESMFETWLGFEALTTKTLIRTEGDALERVLFLAHRLSVLLARYLNEMEVTLPEARMLQAMSGGAAARTSPSDIARVTGLSRNAVSAALYRFEVRGLIARQAPSPEDRRYLRFALSDIGESIARGFQDTLDITGRALLINFDRHERAAFLQLLVRVDRAACEAVTTSYWQPRPRRRKRPPARRPFGARGGGLMTGG